MLERFSKQVREIVRNAEREARALDAPAVGSEHLLLALVDSNPLLFAIDRLPPPPPVPPPGGAPRGTVIVSPDLPDDYGALRRLLERDTDAALEALGISLDDVRRRVEAEFGSGAWDESGGEGRLTFNREAKQALELALRIALETKTRRIGTNEVAIALVRQRGRARALVEELGVDPDVVESRLLGMANQVAALAGR